MQLQKLTQAEKCLALRRSFFDSNNKKEFNNQTMLNEDMMKNLQKPSPTNYESWEKAITQLPNEIIGVLH